jgi:hypothetical protein
MGRRSDARMWTMIGGVGLVLMTFVGLVAYGVYVEFQR